MALNETAVLRQLILLWASTSKDSAFLQSLNASWTGNICNENSTSWWGVACTFGHVTGLDLSGADVGAVPLPQIHLLEKLRSFKCVKCSFTGPLPAEWASAPELEQIWIEDSPLNSTFPQEWANSSSFKSVAMRNCNLTGTLPAVWTSFSNLEMLDLTFNNLTGTLPTEWTNLRGLDWLYLGMNSLTGTLPARWNITWRPSSRLNLGFNQLTGSLPPSWGAWTNLSGLWLTGNNLSGPVPTEWCKLTQLEIISMAGNELTGTLPACWANFSSLVDIVLGHNLFTGPLPSSWGLLSNLQYLDLFHNQLTGTLPSSWASMSSTIPPDSSLQISLDTNRLNGTLPPEWKALDKLTHLCLANNSLTGSLPGVEWATGMKALQKMSLYNNSFSGELPGSWFNTQGVWPALKFIDLRSTNVGGRVPAVTGDGTFFWTPTNSPTLVIDEPSKTGLCGPLPSPRPQIVSYGEGHLESLEAAGAGLRLAYLPPCPPVRDRLIPALLNVMMALAAVLAVYQCLVFALSLQRFLKDRRRVQPV